MFEMVDWDKIFNWKLWQIVKWIYMAVVIIGIIWLLYLNYTHDDSTNKILTILFTERGK